MTKFKIGDEVAFVVAEEDISHGATGFARYSTYTVDRVEEGEDYTNVDLTNDDGNIQTVLETDLRVASEHYEAPAKVASTRSIEEIFLRTKEIFLKQATQAAEEALDKIYIEYLPHVESDTQSNVYFQTACWLERFFADTLREDDIKVSVTGCGWDARKARQKIYEDNKEEIQAAIGKDLQDKIDSLRESGRHDCGYSPYQ